MEKHMIAHILLLPHPEHRERLLAPGAPVCCWLATRSLDEPTRTTVRVCAFGWSVGGTNGMVWWPHDNEFTTEGEEMRGIRLVLAQDGAVCPEGVDRLARVSGWSIPRQEVDRAVMVALDGDAIQIAGFRRAVAPLGTPVLLDADGKVIDV